jgi:hypothetical protein
MKPVQIIVTGHKVTVADQTFAFSTQAAAQQAQCTLREPDHLPRGGNKFDNQDVAVFQKLQAAFNEASQ